MRTIRVLCSVLLFLTATYAQDLRPAEDPFASGGFFLFTATSLRPGRTFIHYDAAFGNGTFEPVGGDHVEQNLGLRTTIGESLTLLAHTGLAFDKGTTRTSLQGELLLSVLRSNESPVDFSAGAGVRHEYSGTNVLLARAIIGRTFNGWRAYGNMLLEKPLASDRDEIDLMTIFGVSYDISPVWHLGIEAVGQDLEGFWEEEEAEGGAVLFLGPVMGFAFERSAWSLTVGGGAIVRATRSSRSSPAVRDIPARNGFVLRAVLGFGI